MRLDRPFETIVPSLDGAVLDVLARSEEALTGRQVAALAPDGSQRGIADVLVRLEAQGVVERRTAGSSHLWRLNDQHLAAEAVLALATAADRLDQRVRDHVEAWAAVPDHVWRFGSSVRGPMTLESDVDLLVIGPVDAPTWEQQTADLSELVERATGNHAAVFEVDGADLLAAIREEPVVRDAIDHGLPLTGDARALRDLRNRVVHGLA